MQLPRPTICLISILLSGCGTTVPDIQEFWGGPGDAGDRVNAIAAQVGCELGKAAHAAIEADKTAAKHNGGLRIAELENWTAELVLLLTIDEKTSLNPSVTPIDALPNMQTFSVGLTATGSTEALRTDKLHLFYPLRQFVDYDNVHPCISRIQTPGLLFVQSDLKLYEWMSREVLPQFTGTAAPYTDIAAKSLAAAFSYDVKFEIVTSGGINPTWKLVTVTANTAGSPLLNSGRDRTQELILTLGPTEPVAAASTKKQGRNKPYIPDAVVFGNAASQSSFSSEFSSEVSAKARTLP